MEVPTALEKKKIKIKRQKITELPQIALGYTALKKSRKILS